MSNSTGVIRQKVLRLQREFKDISRSPDTQISVAYDDTNLTHMHALITGPVLSDFVFEFPTDYPSNPPKVTALTTGSIYNRTRFNPNIYANGKVCLSILGTWRGEAGEQWSAAHGILSILISIQSLMSDNPYLNEPGFENTKDMAVMETYNRKIMHETIRVTICDRLERYLSLNTLAPQQSLDNRSTTVLDGESTSSTNESNIAALIETFCTCKEHSPFEDYCKRLFILYYDVYQANIEKEVAKGIVDGTRFVRTRFEGQGNTMDGTFEYAKLKARLEKIYKALKVETESWINTSKEWISDETLMSSNLKSQFDQINTSGDYSENFLLTLENPFVWIVTIMNFPAGSLYEDGMFP
ncbi:hypothetical protein HK100_007628, partial [Physocladia obscura]